jgi:hypothetical protein
LGEFSEAKAAEEEAETSVLGTNGEMGLDKLKLIK